jgi:hypothetical protein
MAWDPIALRGLAVVFKPQTQSTDPRDRQFAEQQRMAKQKQDLDWLDKNSKLDFKEVSFELQKPLADKFISTKKQMDVVSKKGLIGELTPADMLTIQQLKNDFDADSSLATSFDKDLKDVNEVLKADKDGLYKRGEVASRLSDMTSQLWTRDQYGDFTVNRNTMSPKAILSDPDMIDDAAISKQFVNEFTDKINEVVSSPGYQTLQSEFKFKDMYETDKTGTPIKDPNTGKYIPKSSPENIALFDANNIRKTKLDRWAQMITPEGENWEKNRAEAFNRFVIQPFAPVSKKVQASNKPEFVMNQGDKTRLINERYHTLRDIVYNFNESSLAQSYDLSNNIRLEFKGGGSKGNLPGETIPDEVVIMKREPVSGDPMDPFSIKSYQWTEYDRLPLRDEDTRETALFKINETIDEAQGKSGLVIGQDEIRKVHNAFKKKTPAKSEADKLGLN